MHAENKIESGDITQGFDATRYQKIPVGMHHSLPSLSRWTAIAEVHGGKIYLLQQAGDMHPTSASASDTFQLYAVRTFQMGKNVFACMCARMFFFSLWQIYIFDKSEYNA